MGFLSSVRRRALALAESMRQSAERARANAERARVDAEREALRTSPDGPYVFLTTTSQHGAEFYLNRGWEIITYSPPAENVAERWHLKHDRQTLFERLGQA